MFMFRLQKIMDEYAGGVSSQFTTNKALLLERASNCWPSSRKTRTSWPPRTSTS